MTSDGAGGYGRTAPGENAIVETYGMPILPGFQALVSNKDVGGLDESELQGLVGFFGKVTIMGLPTGTGDLWSGAAIGGERIGMGEAGDISDLTIDDDGKDISNARKGFEQMDSRGLFDGLANTNLESGNFLLYEIEEDELLLRTALCFWGQLKDGLIQPTAARFAEKLFPVFAGESVLGEGGMDAVVDGVAKLGESHPRAGEFTFVADLAGWDPNGGESDVVLQDGQAVGVDLVGLVDVAHHDLGLSGMRQAGETTSFFDLVGDPMPISDGFEGNGSP